MRTRGTLSCPVVALVAGLVAAAGMVPAAARGGIGGGPACVAPSRTSVVAADALLEDRYRFPPHPTVVLPHDLTWREDPLRDRNWRFQLHSLSWTKDLLFAWRATGSRAYRDRFVFLLQDWMRDNAPTSRADFAWDHHATAWRAMTYACAADYLPRRPWLDEALELHGRVLADPAFQARGNHALNQAIGLLAVGCVLDREGWMSLAAWRIGRLAQQSIDDEGVSNEQSISYGLYNFLRYREAERHLGACRSRVPTVLAVRTRAMPDFLAHATLPNGEYESIGDTDRGPAARIAGTTAEYAATMGASGVPPTAPFRTYRAGYVFGRSGWGEERPFRDEVFYSVRFGRRGTLHSHADQGALTLYGGGSRLLLDPGKYTYDRDRWRYYFTGEHAHNVVAADGVLPDDAEMSLVTRQGGGRFDHLVVKRRWKGIEWVRTVFFSRGLRYLVVDDRVRAARAQSFRQLWHLPPGADPAIGPDTARTRLPGGNLLLEWSQAPQGIEVFQGSVRPIQGWVSYRYGHKVAAPVVEAVARGRRARFLTFIDPLAGSAEPRLHDLEELPDGFRLMVTTTDGVERVELRGGRVTFTELPPRP